MDNLDELIRDLETKNEWLGFEAHREPLREQNAVRLTLIQYAHTFRGLAALVRQMDDRLAAVQAEATTAARAKRRWWLGVIFGLVFLGGATLLGGWNAFQLSRENREMRAMVADLTARVDPLQQQVSRMANQLDGVSFSEFRKSLRSLEEKEQAREKRNTVLDRLEELKPPLEPVKAFESK